jgi:hypothetical protein
VTRNKAHIDSTTTSVSFILVEAASTLKGALLQLTRAFVRYRQVGVCLKHLPVEEAASEFHEGNVPWQRVINSKGGISPRLPTSSYVPALGILKLSLLY